MEKNKKWENQPVSSVEWVPRGKLKANNYNPNHVAPPEFKLLKRSILADGWTQPIVVRRDYQIVDGFHRWTIAADKQVAAMTGGRVPIVFLREGLSESEQMASTIRHNRARGQHHVLKMAALVQDLIDAQGVSKGDVQKRLGMEREEVERLYDRGGMIERGSAEDFHKAWIPGDDEPAP